MKQKHSKPVALSVITTTDPVAQQLPALLKALSLQAVQTSCFYEVVIVDDLAQWSARPPVTLFSYPNLFVRPVTPSRRQGQQRALRQGISMAEGPLILTIDPDLHPCTRDIPAMMAMIGGQCWAVHGARTQRADITFLRRACSKVANVLTSLITGLAVPDIGSPVTLFSRKAIASIPEPSSNIVHLRLHSYLALGNRLACHFLEHGSPAGTRSQYSLHRLTLLFLQLISESLFARKAMGQRIERSNK